MMQPIFIVTIFWLLIVTVVGSKILFIRGGLNSGGFVSGGDNSQLSDINDCSLRSGNGGWGQLGLMLRGNGITVDQITELERSTGGANISKIVEYDAVVFGSNNFLSYSSADADILEKFIQNGGSALFISDANFGLNWGNAPTSDQTFLVRFGLTMNQDTANGVVSFNQFLDPNHPILQNVNSFSGEGTSFITIVPGFNTSILVPAKTTVRENTGLNQGPTRAITSNDGCLVISFFGAGKVVASCDRNTFFNSAGAGTNIFDQDNLQYAKNLYQFLLNLQTPLNAKFEQCSRAESLKLSLGLVLTCLFIYCLWFNF